MKLSRYIACFFLGCLFSGVATWKVFETLQLDTNLVTAITNLNVATTNFELLEEERYQEAKKFAAFLALYEFDQIAQTEGDALLNTTKEEVNKWLSKRAEYESKLKPLNQ